MDHPLTQNENSDLRKRVIQLFQNSYRILRAGNIVFVCGGNSDTDMRPRFRSFAKDRIPEFEIFFPEFAMEDYFSGEAKEPFDIADFEVLVGDLSHAIVIFPEAPGSFAETGYFSAVERLSRKIILALDTSRQGPDSFLSMGPAKKIASSSIFQPNIQIDYKIPDFEVIATRLVSRGMAKNKKTFKIEKFHDQSSYELLCLIWKIVSLLSISTIDDITYIMRGLYSSHVSIPKIRHIASILVGAGYLSEIGDYGHYFCSSSKKNLLEARDGYLTQESAILLELAAIYQAGDPEFLSLVEASR